MHFGVFSLLYFIPFMDRSAAVFISVIFPLIYFYEIKSDNALMTFIFGKRLRVFFGKEKITIHHRWLRKPWEIERLRNPCFMARRFDKSIDPIYQDSWFLEVVTSNHFSEFSLEVYDNTQAHRFAENCNFMNQINHYTSDKCADPRARWLGEVD